MPGKKSRVSYFYDRESLSARLVLMFAAAARVLRTLTCSDEPLCSRTSFFSIIRRTTADVGGYYYGAGHPMKPHR
jgi:hypothetical protein